MLCSLVGTLPFRPHELLDSKRLAANITLAMLIALAAFVLSGCGGAGGNPSGKSDTPRDTELMQYTYSNGTNPATEGSQASSTNSADGNATNSSNNAASNEAASSAAGAGATAAGTSSTAGAAQMAGTGQLAGRLSAAIDPLVAASGMQVGVCVIDLETGERASINGGQQIAAASMIKLAIAAAFLQQVDAGAFSLDATYTLQAADIVGGTGTIGGMGAGAQLTYRELLDRMIDVSDNTAANILTNAVGMSAVNAQASALGLAGTHMNRLMMDEAAMSAGIENYTTADDLATILQMVYEGRLVSQQASSELLGALEGQTDNAGIAQGLPAHVFFAHKTGTLTIARNDAGIAECDHPFVVAVMCGGPGFYETGANTLMADIGAAVYQEVAGE